MLRAFRSKVSRYLPPARLLWVALAVIAVWGQIYLNWIGPGAFLLPAIAALIDLGFQRVRFPHVRMPDSAVATGFLVALVLPPTAPLLLSGTVVVAAIALKHALRRKGHPLWNPAALGIFLGAVFLGLAPAWWVDLGTPGLILLPTLGLLLLARDRTRWRSTAAFFVTYGVLASMDHYFFSLITSPEVFVLTVLDPALVFFGLFMASDPRTSMADPAAQPIFGVIVGVLGLGLSFILPTLGLLTALLMGNVIAIALQWKSVKTTTPQPKKKRRKLPALASADRWTIPRRAGIGFVVLIALTAVAAGTTHNNTPAPVLVAPGGTVSAPPSGGSSAATGNCQHDNASIPASTLAQLHKMLGPSVILSYDASNGVTVFYDPVNQVTVTETDLYEDYGYAEFNGDDYAVSGCVP